MESRKSRLIGKSHEAVEVNAKIDKLLLAINSAFDRLAERKQPFDATTAKIYFKEAWVAKRYCCPDSICLWKK